MKCREVFERAAAAGRKLASVAPEKIDAMLVSLAEETERQSPFLISENEKDLALMDSSDPKFDRLKLTPERIKMIAGDIRNVASLPSPLGRVLEQRELNNGLQLSKVSVPFGVVGVIYEARPNVTSDVFSLCVKSGNACVLKGGSDAKNSNAAIAKIIRETLKRHGIDTSLCSMLPADRAATEEMLSARGLIDVIIPRGSRQLIDFVADNSKVPVIETGAGIVHIYLDEEADIEKAAAVINNAKTRRVSVCNALDCLVVNERQLVNLYHVVAPLASAGVLVYADSPSYKALKGKYPDNLLEHAVEEAYGTEFLDYKMSVKTVAGLDEALDHIAKNSSKHSESIISNSISNTERFLKEVDAAVVYSNTSTAFTDGAQFGLGAEIGISTQKLHARGPMALKELTSYKWIVRGNGQVRP